MKQTGMKNKWQRGSKIGNFSCNINEVLTAVLNSLFFILFFFYKKIFHAPKAPKALKAQKYKDATEQKNKNANKRTKIKNARKNI